MKSGAWTILVIDDSPEDRAEVRQLLLKGSDRRYHFIEAGTGAAGLREALAALPDCVVLDYNLPDADAPKLLAALAGPDGATICPVVVLTGSDRLDLGRAVVRAGAQDFLGKSWMVAESLTRAIENAVERWAMGREWRASEEAHRLFFESAAVGMVCLDPATGRFLRANPKFCEMTGYTAAELAGRSLSELTHPDDVARGEGALERFLSGRSPSHVSEERLIRMTGEELWVITRARMLFDAAGRPATGICVVSDISERKRAEDRLRTSEAQFRSTFEQSAVGMVQVSATTGRFIRMNAEYCELTGYSAEELVEMTPSDLNFAEDRAADVDAFGLFLRGEVGLYEQEKRYLRKDGKVIWVHVNATLLRDADGRPEQTMAVVQNVTARKQAEDTLRASEERFRSLVTATTQIVWTCTPEGLAVKDSPTWRAFTGQTLVQWLGSGWVNAIHPDDQEATLASWQRGLATTTPVTAEYRLRQHDGEYHWMSVHVVPVIDEAGVLREWVGTITDIDEKKRVVEALRESEGRLRAATAAVTDLIWTNNADGLMEGEQRGWEDFTGQSREQYQGYGWSEAVHPEDAPTTIAAWTRAVVDKRTFVFEHRVRRRDGEWRLCTIRAVPIFNADQTIREWVGVHTDITERKRDEEKLQQLAAELVKANLRKDEFLATLAHELRNPLAPIRNGLQLMRLARGKETDIGQVRAMMERQVAQMVRLVDDLMDVSRISRGMLELRKERIPLALVLNSAVETSLPLIEQMGQELTVTLPEQALFVDADMTRLAQVFLNLLNNAAKYSERGGHIQLDVELQDGEVMVTVKDTGIGIAADQMPRIFDMFTQIDGSLERSRGGLGIGLTLVQRLVEMHGGRLEASSEGPGKGSKFVVHLPVVIEASTPHETGDETEWVVAPSQRILVVDDNLDGADSLSEMLRIMGNDTRTAYDGQAGVDMAGKFRPDVVLLDIGLPKLNGYEACRRIREQSWGKGVVLVAVTGWGQDEDRRRSRDAGFDLHLVKPVDPQLLMKALAELQSRKQ
jgi:PAS domain S-box-containing protein